MKKVIILLGLLLVLSPLFGSSQAFLASVVNVNDNTTAVNGTDFTSTPVNLSGKPGTVLLTVQFTPAAAASVSIDFLIQASYDGGTTYSYYAIFPV